MFHTIQSRPVSPGAGKSRISAVDGKFDGWPMTCGGCLKRTCFGTGGISPSSNIWISSPSWISPSSSPTCKTKVLSRNRAADPQIDSRSFAQRFRYPKIGIFPAPSVVLPPQVPPIRVGSLGVARQVGPRPILFVLRSSRSSFQ